MKTGMKILIVCIGGAACWGLAYTASLYPTYSIVCASFSSASTALVGILVGWTPKV